MHVASIFSARYDRLCDLMLCMEAFSVHTEKVPRINLLHIWCAHSVLCWSMYEYASNPLLSVFYFSIIILNGLTICALIFLTCQEQLLLKSAERDAFADSKCRPCHRTPHLLDACKFDATYVLI